MSTKYDNTVSGLSISKIVALVVSAIILIAVLCSIGNMFENLGAGQNMVIQSPISGKLNTYTTPGVKFQSFGTPEKYNKRGQFWFSAKPDQGGKEDGSLRVRFNDGGHATISGSISWEMPSDNEHFIALHTKYGTFQNVQDQLVRTVIEKAAYMTGPLMSSKESSAERRNELLRLIEDQAQNGIYQTETVQQQVVDPLTSQTKMVSISRIKMDAKGMPARVDNSPFEDYGIRTSNLSINEVKYDEVVEK